MYGIYQPDGRDVTDKAQRRYNVRWKDPVTPKDVEADDSVLSEDSDTDDTPLSTDNDSATISSISANENAPQPKSDSIDIKEDVEMRLIDHPTHEEGPKSPPTFAIPPSTPAGTVTEARALPADVRSSVSGAKMNVARKRSVQTVVPVRRSARQALNRSRDDKSVHKSARAHVQKQKKDALLASRTSGEFMGRHVETLYQSVTPSLHPRSDVDMPPVRDLPGTFSESPDGNSYSSPHARSGNSITPLSQPSDCGPAPYDQVWHGNRTPSDVAQLAVPRPSYGSDISAISTLFTQTSLNTAPNPAPAMQPRRRPTNPYPLSPSYSNPYVSSASSLSNAAASMPNRPPLARYTRRLDNPGSLGPISNFSRNSVEVPSSMTLPRTAEIPASQKPLRGRPPLYSNNATTTFWLPMKAEAARDKIGGTDKYSSSSSSVSLSDNSAYSKFIDPSVQYGATEVHSGYNSNMSIGTASGSGYSLMMQTPAPPVLLPAINTQLPASRSGFPNVPDIPGVPSTPPSPEALLAFRNGLQQDMRRLYMAHVARFMQGQSQSSAPAAGNTDVWNDFLNSTGDRRS
ncbi:hypothetical protein VNI00_014707 [Paramarasmius palmivorus]|uniref:Uncharacterized protein n=1 Tax=Paramarasmius palmivorus TaxID=297713 RepID=A0AAW0BS07_9AGAR